METQQTKVVAINCATATTDQLKHAIRHRLPIAGILATVTHPGTHIDEAGTDLLAKCTAEGKEKFPGLEDFMNLMTKKQLQELNFWGEEGFYLALKNRYLIIGTGGGVFDEHPQNKHQRKSCFQKMYDYLDMDRNKDNRQIFYHIKEYINFEDRNGAASRKIQVREDYSEILEHLDGLNQEISEINQKEHILQINRLLAEKAETQKGYEKILGHLREVAEISSMLKDGMQAYSENLEEQSKLLAAVKFLLLGKIEAQKKFLQEQKTKYFSLKYQEVSFLTGGKPHKPKAIAIIQTAERNSCFINKVALKQVRTDQRFESVLAILVNGKGQLQIMPMQPGFESLLSVKKVLQVMVAIKKGKKVPNWQELNGEHDPNDFIFFHEEANAIYNGSLTQYDTEGVIGGKTGITLEDVIEALRIGLNEDYFSPAHATSCQAGICTADKKRCSFKPYGLQRCFEVRNKMKIAENVKKG